MALAPEQTGIGIRRHFTSPGVDPYDEVTWERRDARLTNLRDGTVAFEQLGVEFPATWSLNATNIVAQKYFRGHLGSPERESSVRQMIDRVVGTIARWGEAGGYFVDAAEAQAFRAELTYLVLTQRASFNSPVWFNIGVAGRSQQASACFILSVDDTMESILNWYVEEGTIFRGGSGSGVNLSRIRASTEALRGGGTASGPVSFMRGADASAGTIKSGGTTRRAAKMVILDVDHPDVEEFVWCKAVEERKARVLRDAGFDMDLDGKDSFSVQYQNANNSVRVSDEFMQAVERDEAWELRARTTGEVVRTVRARELFREIAEAAWECADPGVQFDTTINRWNTVSNTGRINASNPCCFVGDTLVDTSDGPVRMELLCKAGDAGERLPLAHSLDLDAGRFGLYEITRVWVAGHATELVDVVTAGGLRLRCTPEHRFLTLAGAWVEARALQPGTAVKAVDDLGQPVHDAVAEVRRVVLDEPVAVYDLEVEGAHNFVVTSEGDLEHAVVVHNSEYMHLDDSACNLASINLLSFLERDGTFDVDGFRHAVEVVFAAQEILVGKADYPTERIGETSRRFRQLGLGYTNLGALLLALGLPYDSDEGRALAAAITALMTGHAYATSARIASRMGPFAGFTENREPMLRVLRMHRDAVAAIDEERVSPELLGAAQEAWDRAVEWGSAYGVRNSQATVLAPTGTISFLLDADTTGIEPDLGLVKTKKLVGGGTMAIVNQTVPRALRRLGYTPEQVDDIVAHVDEHHSIIGAPHLAAEHLPVFACSMGDNVIGHMGHVKMMAAVQPFISGAISKCVTGDTLVPTAEGLLRIGSLHRGEEPDTLRSEVIEVASLGGTQKTDAFYYGGPKPTRSVVLRSGHRITGTPNHRLLVATDGGFSWRRLDEIQPGDAVAVQYGDELWSYLPAELPPMAGMPGEMSAELAFLLGALAVAGEVDADTGGVRISSGVPQVRARLAAAWRDLFGLEADQVDAGPHPAVRVESGAVVAFLAGLGAGARGSAARLPDPVLRSPREAVLAYVEGLALAAHVSLGGTPRWSLCLDAPALLDDLQAVLTNLGVRHSRRSTGAYVEGHPFDELRVEGEQAWRLVELVPLADPLEAAHAAELSGTAVLGGDDHDRVPGIAPAELYRLVPEGERSRFGALCEPGAGAVTRRDLERAAAVPGVVLPPWVHTVLDDDLHFSEVESVADAGWREVFDVSVPATHAFVANGLVNHNTVNLPESATVDGIEELLLESWKLGLKAVAIYRDNCKVGQPLSTGKKAEPEAGGAERALAREVERVVETIVMREPEREKLPRTRSSKTFSFRVADCHGYVTVGEYADGRPGEIFVRVSKQGSTLAGVMDAFAISVSHGLQYGVPLRAFVDMFVNMRFEPAGITDDPEIRFASSLVDYIFRRLAVEYLPHGERVDLGILTTDERLQPTLPGVEEAATRSVKGQDVAARDEQLPLTAPVRAVEPGPGVATAVSDAPYCMTCGIRMVRAGSCYACQSCGSTSGCS
ncbi:MAG: hypothetical protein IPM45_04575 [Acidimicrobiales bacterium]|nr:hypothetical protein [Acidimicrobiales bacterium]